MSECIETKRPLADHEVLKKMRFHRGLSRRSAGLLVNCSRSTVQRFESGRYAISYKQKQQFSEAYGFTIEEFIEIKSGKNLDPMPRRAVKKVKIIEHKHLRRSYKKVVTKEIILITRMRKRHGLSQYKLSRICGWCKTTIGHIEQGRIELTKRKLDTILAALKCSQKDFKAQLQSDVDRYSLEEVCIDLIQKIEDSKLLTVQAMLKSLAS